MRFAILACWLALCVPAVAEPYTYTFSYGWYAIPYVEKLENLSCAVQDLRLEQLAVSLRRGGYKPRGQRKEGWDIFTIWSRESGQKVEVLHKFLEGTTCVKTFVPPLAITASVNP